jgi:hypothetical protein
MAARTDWQSSTAFGVSEWTQIVSAPTAMSLPPTLFTLPSLMARTALGVNLLMQRVDHAHQGHLEDVGRVGDRMRGVLHARGHAVERAVRLDVVELHALGLEEAFERADLIDDAIGELFPGDLHLAAAEALEVG